jgi:hypothetical protein
MEKQTIIEQLGFERAIDVNSPINKLHHSQQDVIEQIKNFDIDKVYFCQDDKNNSYPAIFIKKVGSFDGATMEKIAEIHRKAWNYKKVSFLYVYSDVEIRIYNCVETPVFISEETDSQTKLEKIELISCKQSDNEQLMTLEHIFSSIAMNSGLIWSIEEAANIRKKIKLQRRVDQYLVESLRKATRQLRSDGLEIGLIHRLILRSLFLLYLEDRGATDKKFYTKIKKGAERYFDILKDTDSTYLLFEKLEKHFNGNVFSVEKDEQKIVTNKHLDIICKCFTHGYNELPLFPDWRVFDFSIIQIELLSQIYENLLATIDKKGSGSYYTPPSLVELILNEKLPITVKEKRYNLKVLDPACGSGIFLVESFKRLVKRYENSHKQELHEKKLVDFEVLKQLLVDNIYGIEYDSNAIKVAAFSLYLALVDRLDPKTLWQNIQLPYLINDPNDRTLKKQGKNLYKRDTIEENKEIENIPFDLVVGNPPFGTETGRRKLLDSVRNYCHHYNFAKELVLPFLHKAKQFTSDDGEIAMIFNTKVLTNTGIGYHNFRKWLMQDCYVEKVYNFSILRKASMDLGGQLFDDAVGPISIVFYKKNWPQNPNQRIVYYAPKTYVKSNVLEGIAIDSTDVKHLPREECQKPDTKIWKIAMWGGMADFELIKRLTSKQYNSIDNFATLSEIKSGVGFGLLTQKKDTPKVLNKLAKIPYLDANNIQRYYTTENNLGTIIQSIKTKDAVEFYKQYYRVNDINQLKEISVFRRLGDIEAYKVPHIVVKKGLENNVICASLIEKDCSFKDGVYGFYSSNKNIMPLNALVAYFNSKLSTYFLFMTISSYGIERDQIMKNEYLSIPINLNKKQISAISTWINDIVYEKKNESFLKIQYVNETFFNQDIEKIINSSLNLTLKEQILINDLVEFNIDLFHNQKKSKAILPVLDVKQYAEMLCSELNDFLEDQNLFANATIYDINIYNPLCLVKICFDTKKTQVLSSKENVDKELMKIDKHLWNKKSENIYFHKKLNYNDGDNIFVIRPNQRRFWSQSMAIEDASELILEILTSEA